MEKRGKKSFKKNSKEEIETRKGCPERIVPKDDEDYFNWTGSETCKKLLKQKVIFSSEQSLCSGCFAVRDTCTVIRLAKGYSKWETFQKSLYNKFAKFGYPQEFAPTSKTWWLKFAGKSITNFS